MNVYARYGFLTLLALTFLMLNAEYVHHLLLPGFMIYDVHRILQLLCFLSMLVPFLVSHRVRTITLTSFTALPRLAKWLLVIFFAWGLLSALHSPDSRHALTMVCHFFLITVLGFFVAGMVREWPNATQNWLLGTFILGIGTYLITEYVNYIFLKTHPELLTPLMRDWDVQLLRFYGYSNPRFLGQILSWTLPIVVLPYLHFKAQNRSTLAFFFLLLAGAWWQMMWLGESRNEYLQLILIAIIMPIAFGRSAKAWLKAEGLSLLVGLALYIVLFHWVLHLPIRTFTDYESQNRLQVWELSVQLISNHPVIGVGPAQFITYATVQNAVSHPHNASLYIASEWGLFPGFIFTILMIWSLIAAFKKAKQACRLNHEHGMIGIALCAALLAATISEQFSGTFLTPASQLMYSLIGGWMLGRLGRTPPIGTRPVSLFTEWAGILCVVLASTAIVKGIFPEVLELPAQVARLCTIQDAERCLLNPSYWSDHPKPGKPVSS